MPDTGRLSLYEPIREHTDFILGSGSDTRVRWAAFLEVILAIACVGTAVVLFPVAKRQSDAAALGFLSARLIEAALILLGVVSVLVTTTLRGNVSTAGAAAGSLTTAGHALRSVYDSSFLLGTSSPRASAHRRFLRSPEAPDWLRRADQDPPPRGAQPPPPAESAWPCSVRNALPENRLCPSLARWRSYQAAQPSRATNTTIETIQNTATTP